MQLILFAETLAVCKLTEQANVGDWQVLPPLHVPIRDPHGQTLICHPSTLAGREADIIDRSAWRCFQIDAVMDFDTIGVLAEFSGILAQAGISILAVCSFETDYLLVPSHFVELARDALLASGHPVSGDP